MAPNSKKEKFHPTRYFSSLVNRELVRMNDQGLETESGDLRPCVPQTIQAPIQSDSQKTLAYTRPKTTYATRPKQPLVAHNYNKIFDTRPDENLKRTVIISSTPQPTPFIYPTEEDLSVEFEPLPVYIQPELSTLAPTQMPIHVYKVTVDPELITTERSLLRTEPKSPPSTQSVFETGSDLLPEERAFHSTPEISESDTMLRPTIFGENVDIDEYPQNRIDNRIGISEPDPYNTPVGWATPETNELPELTSTIGHVDETELDPYLVRFRPEELCQSHTCGEHGICEPVNITHVTCSCKDYYIGPNCDICRFCSKIFRSHKQNFCFNDIFQSWLLF
jgi:hypothetical protein